jgi:hypothetical protein
LGIDAIFAPQPSWRQRAGRAWHGKTGDGSQQRDEKKGRELLGLHGRIIECSAALKSKNYPAFPPPASIDALINAV